MAIVSLTSLIILIIFIILTANTPLSLGCGILSIALLGSLIIASSSSSWLAIFTFLIYIGGLLVLFIYFTATIPNQRIQQKVWWKLSLISLFIPASIIWLPIINSPTPNKIFYILDSINLTLYLFLILVLLLTLVASVKLTQTNRAPIRKFNV
jgi:hypothetical protein